MKYNPDNNSFFEYNLPPLTADTYANNALRILSEIKSKFPEFYDSFKSPSEVLTLSGVRAFDTYYSLGKGSSAKRISELKKFLECQGILLIEEKTIADFDSTQPDDQPYSLLHRKAFSEIPKRYINCPGWEYPLNGILDAKDFFLWWFIWQRRIAASEDKVLIKWHKADWWAGHNISFGMLLGYPGEAIASFLNDDESIKIGNARIKHAEKFDRAQPYYMYPSDLSVNENIVNHEKLWSDILSKVYVGLE